MIITVDETVATPQLHRGTSRRAETATRPSPNFFRSDFRNRDREFSHPSFEDVDWRQYYAPWFIPPPPPHPHFMQYPYYVQPPTPYMPPVQRQIFPPVPAPAVVPPQSGPPPAAPSGTAQLHGDTSAPRSTASVTQQTQDWVDSLEEEESWDEGVGGSQYAQCIRDIYDALPHEKCPRRSTVAPDCIVAPVDDDKEPEFMDSSRLPQAPIISKIVELLNSKVESQMNMGSFFTVKDLPKTGFNERWYAFHTPAFPVVKQVLDRDIEQLPVTKQKGLQTTLRNISVPAWQNTNENMSRHLVAICSMLALSSEAIAALASEQQPRMNPLPRIQGIAEVMNRAAVQAGALALTATANSVLARRESLLRATTLKDHQKNALKRLPFDSNTLFASQINEMRKEWRLSDPVVVEVKVPDRRKDFERDSRKGAQQHPFRGSSRGRGRGAKGTRGKGPRKPTESKQAEAEKSASKF